MQRVHYPVSIIPRGFAVKISNSLSTGTSVLDKAAANRFIKHAIAQAKEGRLPNEETAERTPRNDVPVMTKMTSKMLERERYQAELRDVDSEEDDDLQVFETSSESEHDERAASSQAKGKQRARSEDVIERQELPDATKRKRRVMDPFVGKDPTVIYLMIWLTAFFIKKRVQGRCAASSSGIFSKKTEGGGEKPKVRTKARSQGQEGQEKQAFASVEVTFFTRAGGQKSVRDELSTSLQVQSFCR